MTRTARFTKEIEPITSRKFRKWCCIVCSKTIPRRRSYCSCECYQVRRYGRVLPKRFCITCGRRLNKQTRNFCSWVCRCKSSVGRARPAAFRRIKRPCNWCGKVLDRPVSLSHSVTCFCNFQCYGAFQSHYRGGSNSPLWRGGALKNYGVGWWRERRKCLKANAICQICGRNRSTVAHHKIPVRCFNFRSDAHHQNNLVAVCVHCHPTAEAKSRSELPLFLNR